MSFTLIITVAILIANVYLFLFGGLTNVIAISSAAFVIGLLVGRIAARYEDDYEEYNDDYWEEDEYIG